MTRAACFVLALALAVPCLGQTKVPARQISVAAGDFVLVPTNSETVQGALASVDSLLETLRLSGVTNAEQAAAAMAGVASNAAAMLLRLAGTNVVAGFSTNAEASAEYDAGTLTWTILFPSGSAAGSVSVVATNWGAVQGGYAGPTGSVPAVVAGTVQDALDNVDAWVGWLRQDVDGLLAGAPLEFYAIQTPGLGVEVDWANGARQYLSITSAVQVSLAPAAVSAPASLELWVRNVSGADVDWDLSSVVPDTNAVVIGGATGLVACIRYDSSPWSSGWYENFVYPRAQALAPGVPPETPGSQTNLVATGGASVITATVDSVEYVVHTFTADGNFTVSSASNSVIDLFMVGGGGGGGYSVAGGGGGGKTMLALGIPVSTQAYAVVVGAGGTGGTSGTQSAGGTASTAFSLSAAGGARGGHNSQVGGSVSGVPGGGGGAGAAGGSGVQSGGSGGSGGAGGGGGSVASAGGGTAGYGYGGAGGAGESIVFWSASAQRVGGGGGGGGRTSAGAGGLGGGGAGGYRDSTVAGTAGAASTGGGGGGGGYGLSGGNGGAGGSGLVVIRYRK